MGNVNSKPAAAEGKGSKLGGGAGLLKGNSADILLYLTKTHNLNAGLLRDSEMLSRSIRSTLVNERSYSLFATEADTSFTLGFPWFSPQQNMTYPPGNEARSRQSATLVSFFLASKGEETGALVKPEVVINLCLHKV